VASFEDMTADEIVEQLYTDADLIPDVDPVADPGSPLARCFVQRGNRDAGGARARAAPRHVRLRHARRRAGGEHRRVRAAGADGRRLAGIAPHGRGPQHRGLRRAVRRAAPAHRLGRERRHHRQDRGVEQARAPPASIRSATRRCTTSSPRPRAALLARTREEANDLDDATQAAVDLSSFAYSATAEVGALCYSAVLSPHRVIGVAGAGSVLSGDYLISRVTHEINEGAYTQKFTLRRNARSAGAGVASLPGGIL